MQTEPREPATSGPNLLPSYALSQTQSLRPKTGFYLGLAVLALLVINSLVVFILFSLIH